MLTLLHTFSFLLQFFEKLHLWGGWDLISLAAQLATLTYLVWLKS